MSPAMNTGAKSPSMLIMSRRSVSYLPGISTTPHLHSDGCLLFTAALGLDHRGDGRDFLEAHVLLDGQQGVPGGVEVLGRADLRLHLGRLARVILGKQLVQV